MPRTESDWRRSVAARLVVQGCRHEAAASTLMQNSRLVSESWAFSTPEGFISKPFRCNRARGVFLSFLFLVVGWRDRLFHGLNINQTLMLFSALENPWGI